MGGLQPPKSPPFDAPDASTVLSNLNIPPHFCGQTVFSNVVFAQLTQLYTYYPLRRAV